MVRHKAGQKLNKHSTASDVVADMDLSGKLAVVTGGNSGIGVETVKALASAGANVIMTSRNLAAGEAVASTLASNGPLKGSIIVVQLDLADLRSVQELAAKLQKEPRIDYLVLNAGVMLVPRSFTKDGFEMHWGTNHVGHVALTDVLLPNLKRQADRSRVVVLTSRAHIWQKGPFDYDDLDFSKRKYVGMAAYAQSKCANLLYAKQLAKELEGSHVEVFAVHPGVVKSALWRNTGLFGSAVAFVSKASAFGVKTAPQGAATTVYAAVSPDLNGRSGLYLADCAEATPSKEGSNMEEATKLYKFTQGQIETARQQREGSS